NGFGCQFSGYISSSLALSLSVSGRMLNNLKEFTPRAAHQRVRVIVMVQSNCVAQLVSNDVANQDSQHSRIGGKIWNCDDHPLEIWSCLCEWREIGGAGQRYDHVAHWSHTTQKFCTTGQSCCRQ